MPAGFSDCRAMRAIDTHHFTQEFAGIFVDHHHTVGSRHEDAMLRGFRHNVIPRAIAAKRVCLHDVIPA